MRHSSLEQFLRNLFPLFGTAGEGLGCPTDDFLAAALEGKLKGWRRRRKVISHVLRCPLCLEHVLVLKQLGTQASGALFPGLSTANWLWHPAMRPVASGALLILVAVALYVGGTSLLQLNREQTSKQSIPFASQPEGPRSAVVPEEKSAHENLRLSQPANAGRDSGKRSAGVDNDLLAKGESRDREEAAPGYAPEINSKQAQKLKEKAAPPSPPPSQATPPEPEERQAALPPASQVTPSVQQNEERRQAATGETGYQAIKGEGAKDKALARYAEQKSAAPAPAGRADSRGYTETVVGGLANSPVLSRSSAAKPSQDWNNLLNSLCQEISPDSRSYQVEGRTFFKVRDYLLDEAACERPIKMIRPATADDEKKYLALLDRLSEEKTTPADVKKSHVGTRSSGSSMAFVKIGAEVVVFNLSAK